MDIDEAVMLTQDRLAEEGGAMGDLLGRFRGRISPVLIGDPQWGRILECAGKLPITMGAQPFGFELPLHDARPVADFGVSLASGNRSGDFFEERALTDKADETAASGLPAVPGNGSPGLAAASDCGTQVDAGVRHGRRAGG